MKEELSKDMKNLRKKEPNRNLGEKSPFNKKQTNKQTKTVEGHSSRIE
jgi:hypothetical protein